MNSSPAKKLIEHVGQTLADLQAAENALRAAEAEQTKVIAARKHAEEALKLAETQHALGKISSKQLESARTQATAAVESQRNLVARIQGLGEHIATFEAPLVGVAMELELTLQEHARAIESEFAGEWNQAAAAWSAMLAKREAIEAAIGARLELPEPGASGEQPDIGELGRPRELLRAVQAAAEKLQGTRTYRIRNRRTEETFDAEGTYTFVREMKLNGRTYAAGDEVVGAVLGEPATLWALRTRGAKRSDLLAMAG